MHIRQKDQVTTMSEGIVCINYGDMNHSLAKFSKDDNKYTCSQCGVVLVIKEPVLTYDKIGRLVMQVEITEEG